MTNEQKVIEQLLANEQQRIRSLEGSGDELILQALNGRPKTAENVVNIWKLVYSSFSVWTRDASHPSNRGANRHENFWLACSEYLKQAGWTDKQLHALRFPSASPLPGRPGFESVLQEFEEEQS
jgi:hypothetical protein